MTTRFPDVQPSNRYRFGFASAYMGVTEYTVSGAGELTVLRVRREASAYERSISNYDDAGWERDVVGAIGLVTACARPVPQDVVDAFNAYRQANYDAQRAYIDARPERYGVIDWENDPVFGRPVIVRGAEYMVRKNRPDMGADWWKYGCVGLGWKINEAA